MNVSCRLTVGREGCDVTGFTNTHIQCAVDRCALIGGGEVEISEGVFQMADSLHLRSGVVVRGQGVGTVLRKNRMKQARLATFHGFGHQDVIVDLPDTFVVGDGIIISDDNAHGFYTTVGTLIRREGDVWFTSRPHAHDYLDDRNGLVKTLFPVVNAVDESNAVLESLVIDGNAAENDVLNGCRGGGFFAHRCQGLVVRGVTVRNMNGDGFSFQTCDDLELADCMAERCAGHGFHPGSGSNRFRIHACSGRDNGACGLFYCLRVRGGVLEDCVFERNGREGVYIGGRDTDNVNRRLTVRGNKKAGLALGPLLKSRAAHNNAVEDCVFDENCAGDGEAEVLLQGETEGIRLTGNRIRRRPGKPGILIRREMRPFVAERNIIEPEGPDGVVDLR